MARTSSISIFAYTDYRRYLRDYYREQKSAKTVFSYRFFAQKAGINSVGLYKDVIEGRQSLGRGLVVKFSGALGHSKRESEYFENMVYFNEARTVEERKLFFQRMLECSEAKAVLIDATRFEYYSRWYYAAVRALLSYISFEGDYAALARALDPPVKESEARKAVDVLLRLGFIRKNGRAGYELTDATVTTGRLSTDAKVQAMQVMSFQRTMTDLGKEAFDRHALHHLDMSTLTVSVSKETYAAMKEEIASLRKKLLLMAENDGKPDRVYQLNYQLFPLTRLDKDGE